MEYWFHEMRDRSERVRRGDKGGRDCACGGCSAVKHITVPYEGKLVPSGVEHHMGRHLFVKRDRLSQPASSTTNCHEMSDDELLAHFSVYDANTFPKSQDRIPIPANVPLVEFGATNSDEDVAARIEALALAGPEEIGSLETLTHFPAMHAPLGECIRYGDVCLAAQRVENGTLRPVLLLVKASLPVVGVSVCVLLNAPGMANEIVLGTHHRVGESLDALLVPDAAIITAARGANWNMTRIQAAMYDAGLDCESFNQLAIKHRVGVIPLPLEVLKVLQEA